MYKEIAKRLKAAGFRHTGNAKGSHEWWERESDGRRVLVPRSTKSRHTANGVMKAAGVDHKF